MSTYREGLYSTHQIPNDTKELVPATLSVTISALLQTELQLLNVKETFWADSEVVLGYIRNESRKFKMFVANKIELIKDHPDVHQ